jgi:hypothetical protein
MKFGDTWNRRFLGLLNELREEDGEADAVGSRQSIKTPDQLYTREVEP